MNKEKEEIDGCEGCYFFLHYFDRDRIGSNVCSKCGRDLDELYNKYEIDLVFDGVKQDE